MIEQLLTEHLDTWTQAVETKSAAGRGSSKKLKLHGIAKLRELILELAVRGQLVPQDESDEPASVLLERIAAERERLVKKPKVLPEIVEDDIPFSTPNGWSWKRLGEVCILENGDRSKNYPNKSLLVDTGIPFVNAGHLQNGRVNKSDMTFITQERFEMLRAGKFADGDILYCLRGSLGKSALVEGFEQGAIASSLVIVKLFAGLDNLYILDYFDAPLSLMMIRKYDNGTAQPNLSAADLGKFLVPIPPEAEQKRIVAKVDELMALCDALEREQDSSIAAHEVLVESLLAALTNAADKGEFKQAWARVAEHFDTLFTTERSVDQLKQTILQLAVMGKLVEQDPTDEPAGVLLERIAAEKERLVKEKKIKKQKVLPEIGEEEKVFELPVGWEWCRLGDFTLTGTGATPSRAIPEYYYPAEHAWVTSGETAQDVVYEVGEKISSKAVDETNVTIYPVGTLVVAMYGQGKTRGQVTELAIAAGTNQACAAIQLVEEAVAHRKYIKLFFQKSYDEIRKLSAGGAQPNLNLGKVSNTVVPVPPLDEQKRIVELVYQLMAFCDQLQIRIGKAQSTQIQIASTLTEWVS